LRKRGEIDELPELVRFADLLEKATIDTIEQGVMTKDLAVLTDMKELKVVNTKDFLQEINLRLKEAL